MTDDDWEKLRNQSHADVQDENGIDVTQIDALLEMSPTERLKSLEAFVRSMVWLDKVREEHDARTLASRAARATSERKG